MDVLNKLDYKEVLVRKPFFEICPEGYMSHGGVYKAVNDNTTAPNDYLYKKIKTQEDFLREYYPTAHRIFDRVAYPDIIKENPDYDPAHPEYGPKFCRQPVTRTAFAFQQLIANKHTLHVTGNDVQFEIADGTNDKEEEQQRLLSTFRKGWLLSNMEIRHYEAVRARMIVAEAAVVGFIADGKFGAKTLSVMNGDKLYPHLDSITGKLKLFARKYFDYDEDGTKRTEWVEVWDEKYLRRYKRGLKGNKVVETIKDIFGIGGYELVTIEEHGFPFIPVAYTRNDDGPCWAPVQRNIEDYEEAFSYLSESNKSLAFPIFYVKGDGDDVQIAGDMNGAVKSIAMRYKENEAGFLNGTDASDAFATQLNKAYELIYELSFTVKPPELKSGDLPGVAVKLLYSPAIEIAMNDAQNMQPFLDQLVDIAKFGIGYENNCQASMMEMPVNAWVEPYIHQNDTELVTNLAQAVQNGFLSKQTASERNSKYSKNDEFDRIMREKKEEQQQDLLMEVQKLDAQLDNTIEEEQAVAKINSGSNGSDINTGHGKKGRPNLSGKQWDKNGNNDIDDKNNWDNYNRNH